MMEICKLIIQDGVDSSEDIFSKGLNFITSNKNSKGKSTFLRLIFYSFGFAIPNMKGMEFDKIYTEIHFNEKEKYYVLKRNGINIALETQGFSHNYLLPNDHISMLSYIFQYDNIKVLKNLLGIIYIDQERGWSLLNRGTVIGRIKFSIEELLSGLNNVDCDDLLEEKDKLLENKHKYESLFEINALSEQIYKENNEFITSDYEKDLILKIKLNKLKIKKTQDDINSIDEILKRQDSMLDYIDGINLIVEKDGIEIPVKRETIKWIGNSVDFLKARKSLLVSDLNIQKRELNKLSEQLNQYYSNNDLLSILNSYSGEKVIDKKLSEFFIDQQMLNSLMEKNNKRLKQINELLKTKIKSNNNYIIKIYNYVTKFAEKLNVTNKINDTKDYIFTSDIKSMSGAILQKIVFAFKLAFLKVIEEEMDTNLFMVIDSPRGKELDDDNFELLESLIVEELKNNQCFVASIYPFKANKVIKIDNKAIEKRAN